MITVAPSGSKAAENADFSNLQDAFDAVMNDFSCSSAEIFLASGVYSGQFYFDGWRNGNGDPVSLSVKGIHRGGAILTGSLYANQPYEDEIKRGTFRSYTLFVSGPSVSLANLTIENSAGHLPPKGLGRRSGQAVALYADSDEFFGKNLVLLGHQDTLFCAPLPEAEREPGGFNGPRKNFPRRPATMLFEKCRIEGTIDFIFGGASAWFDHCQIVLRPLYRVTRDPEQNSRRNIFRYIAAPCADRAGKKPLLCRKKFYAASKKDYLGFLFNRCSFMESDFTLFKKEDALYIQEAPVYLARPWRPFGGATFVNCRMQNGLIAPERFSGWKGIDDKADAMFEEMGTKLFSC